MSTTANDLQGMVRGMHHVGLPSVREDWDEISAFWRTLGLRCETHEVERDDYDHAGAGMRLHVMGSGYQLLVSYFVTRLTREELLRFMPDQHVGFRVDASMLERLRTHERFERETDWPHALVSVFLQGPYGLHVECVTRDPSFHCDEL